MTIPSEDVFMRYIGLGNHYNYFNGSGSCGYIRLLAVRRLQELLNNCSRGRIGQWGDRIGTIGDHAEAREEHEKSQAFWSNVVEEDKEPNETHIRYATNPMPEWKVLEIPIAPLHREMFEALGLIARHCDDSDYTLTKTWEACSYVIQWHIQAGSMEKTEQTKFLNDMCKHLKQHYLGNRSPVQRYDLWE